MFEHFDVNDNFQDITKNIKQTNKQRHTQIVKRSHQTLIRYTSVHFLVGQYHSLKLIKLAFKLTYKFVPI